MEVEFHEVSKETGLANLSVVTEVLIFYVLLSLLLLTVVDAFYSGDVGWF